MRHHETHRGSEWPQFTDPVASRLVHGRTVTAGSSGNSIQSSLIHTERAISPSVARQLPLPNSTSTASMTSLGNPPNNSGRSSPIAELSSPIRRSSTGLVAAPTSPEEKRRSLVGLGSNSSPQIGRGLPGSDLGNAVSHLFFRVVIQSD